MQSKFDRRHLCEVMDFRASVKPIFTGKALTEAGCRCFDGTHLIHSASLDRRPAQRAAERLLLDRSSCSANNLSAGNENVISVDCIA